MSNINDTESAQSLYTTAKTELMNIQSTVDKIHGKMTKTFAQTTALNTGFLEIEDCRVFRKILHEFEIETCHKFNWSLYIMVCVMGVGLFFLYVASVFLFLELRNSNSKVAPPPVKA